MEMFPPVCWTWQLGATFLHWALTIVQYLSCSSVLTFNQMYLAEYCAGRGRQQIWRKHPNTELWRLLVSRISVGLQTHISQTAVLVETITSSHDFHSANALSHLPCFSPKSSWSISLLLAVGLSAGRPSPSLLFLSTVKQPRAVRAECPKPLKPSRRKHSPSLQKEVESLPKIKWRTTNKWSNWAH